MEEFIKQLPQIGQIGGTAFVAVVLTYLYVYYGKKKDPLNGTGKLIFTELKNQNENHLNHIQKEICDGFSNISKSIDSLSIKQDKTNEILYEIKGILKAK